MARYNKEQQDADLKRADRLILEQNDELMNERDEVRKWTLEISDKLGLEPRPADTALESWRQLRHDVLEKLK